MTVDQMRIRIAKAYDGPNWRNKVSAMTDNQVVAVYYRLARSGVLDGKSKKRSEEKHGAKQLSFEDII